MDRLPRPRTLIQRVKDPALELDDGWPHGQPSSVPTDQDRCVLARLCLPGDRHGRYVLDRARTGHAAVVSWRGNCA